jgi:serine/threonine protein phosphatase PrpC
MTRTLRAEAQAITDVGHMREHNEDFFGSFPEEDLYVVADGMGGHSSGDRASKLAVDMLRDFFHETRRDPAKPWPFKMDRARTYEENRLSTGIRIANRRIFDDAEKNIHYRGMGTTIVALSVTGDRAQIAHVGDSRVYRLRDSALELLTRDHSLINDYLRAKPDLTEEELAELPKNVITRALGMRDDLEVEVRSEELRTGDLYLLCTDGLHGLVEDKEIAGLLRASPALPELTRKLMEAALNGGGTDNVTLILVRLSAA